MTTPKPEPSAAAFDVASDWQGHQFSCAIYGEAELPDTACTCIVRKLALSIDAAIDEARVKAIEECMKVADAEADWREWPASTVADSVAAAIRALIADGGRS